MKFTLFLFFVFIFPLQVITHSKETEPEPNYAAMRKVTVAQVRDQLSHSRTRIHSFKVELKRVDNRYPKKYSRTRGKELAGVIPGYTEFKFKVGPAYRTHGMYRFVNSKQITIEAEIHENHNYGGVIDSVEGQLYLWIKDYNTGKPASNGVRLPYSESDVAKAVREWREYRRSMRSRDSEDWPDNDDDDYRGLSEMDKEPFYNSTYDDNESDEDDCPDE